MLDVQARDKFQLNRRTKPIDCNYDDYDSTSSDEDLKFENLDAMDSFEILKIDTTAKDPKKVQDYLAVCYLITRLPGFMVYDILANAFLSSKKRRPFRDTLLDSLMGRCYRSSTLPQLRIMCGKRALMHELSSPLYYSIGRRKNMPNYNTEFKGFGCAARWICEVPERKLNDPVLLYFHGGGYALKTCQPQVDFISKLSKKLRKTYSNLSVLILDYTIAPWAKYPVQHNQAVSCLRALQQTCTNIIIFGDSCGGNLALSMLQEESVLNYKHILGCMLVSPWVDVAAEGGSMNSKRDILNKKRLDEMTSQFVDKNNHKDPMVSPIHADPAVWRRVLPTNSAVVWGSIECLADQAAKFTEIAEISNFHLEDKGTHDCILRGMQPKPCKFIYHQIHEWIACAN